LFAHEYEMSAIATAAAIRSAITNADRSETLRRGNVTAKLCAFVPIVLSLLSPGPTLRRDDVPVGAGGHVLHVPGHTIPACR
jgi:hypothetical protein